MRRLTLVILATLLPVLLVAQPLETRWTRTLPGVVTALRELPDGSVVAAGNTARDDYHGRFAFLCRLTADGKILWTRTYGRLVEEDSLIPTTGGPEVAKVNGQPVRVKVADPGNFARDMLVLSDGTILLVTRHQPDSARQYCHCLIYINASGDSLGCRYLCPGDRSALHGIDQTPSGDLIAFGTANVQGRDCRRFTVLRLSERADTLALHEFERDCRSCPSFIRRTSDGGCAIGGTSGFSSLSRLDSSGKLLWTVCSEGSRSASILHFCPLRDGGILALGATGSARQLSPPQTKDGPKSVANTDVALTKYGVAGDTVWHRTLPVSEPSLARQAVELDNGTLLVAGTAGRWRQEHSFLYALSASGDSLWSFNFGAGQAQELVNMRNGDGLLASAILTKHAADETTTVTRFSVTKEKKRP